MFVEWVFPSEVPLLANSSQSFLITIAKTYLISFVLKVYFTFMYIKNVLKVHFLKPLNSPFIVLRISDFLGIFVSTKGRASNSFFFIPSHPIHSSYSTCFEFVCLYMFICLWPPLTRPHYTSPECMWYNEFICVPGTIKQ